MIDSVRRLYEANKSPVLLFDTDLMLKWHNPAAEKLVETGRITQLHQLCFLPDLVKEQDKLESGTCCRIAGNPVLDIPSVLLQPLGSEENTVFLAILSIRSENWKLPSIESIVDTVMAQYRDPIFAIHNMLAPLKKELEKHEDYDSCSYVDRIGLKCYETMRATSNLTNYFKYHAVDFQPKKARVALNQYLDEACRMARQFVARTENGFRYEICQESIVSEIDPQMLDVAFFNLIANSCLYTNPGNEITVRLEKLDQDYIIMVSDKGLGIPEEVQPHIFEPFYSYDPDGSPAKGVGLGLPIVKQMTDLHYGSCMLISERNQGTTVALRLPIIDESNDKVLEAPGTAINGRFSPPYIYLVDICGVNTVETY